ncbi:MAG: hypothetical protein AVDCRST_MAG69-2208, partial [uncultured Solirubrobacteraceae bacterium]
VRRPSTRRRPRDPGCLHRRAAQADEPQLVPIAGPQPRRVGDPRRDRPRGAPVGLSPPRGGMGPGLGVGPDRARGRAPRATRL